MKGAYFGKEAFAVSRVAEGFSATGASRRECSGPVAAGEAFAQVSAAHELVQESGVEAVAGADGIDRDHFLWRGANALGALLSQGSFGTEFHYNQRD